MPEIWNLKLEITNLLVRVWRSNSEFLLSNFKCLICLTSPAC